MSIYHIDPRHAIPSDWYQADEPTPVDVLVAPADPEPCPCEDHPPRYVIRRERGGWSVVDRSQDGPDGGALVVAWHLSRRDAADDATDRNAEDWPDLGRWWLTAPPSELLDVPVRLAPQSAARSLRRIESDAYPPF